MGLVKKIVMNKLLNWVACTEADLVRRFRKPWENNATRIFLTMSSSQMISPMAYISCSIPFCNLSRLAESSWSLDLTTIFALGSLDIFHGLNELCKIFCGGICNWCKRRCSWWSLVCYGAIHGDLHFFGFLLVI